MRKKIIVFGLKFIVTFCGFISIAVPAISGAYFYVLPALSSDAPNDNLAYEIQNVFWADYLASSGKIQNSIDVYKELLENAHESKKPVHFLKNYLHALAQKGAWHEIVSYIPMLKDSFERDQDVQLLFADALEKTGHTKQAHDYFIVLSHKFPGHQTIAYRATESYKVRKEMDNALDVIDSFLNSAPKQSNNFIFYFLKAQICLQIDKRGLALESIILCVNSFPNFDKGWLLFGFLQEQRGDLIEAMRGYANFLRLTNGDNGEIKKHLMQLNHHHKTVSQNRTTVPEKSVLLQARLLRQEKKYQQALALLDKQKLGSLENREAKLLRIELLNDSKQFSKLTKILKKYLIEGPDQEYWFTVLHGLCESTLSYHKAISIIEDVIKIMPDAILPMLNLADLYMRSESYNTALLYLKKSLSMVENLEMKEKILFNMGLIYYDQRDFSSMEKVLKEAIVSGSKFPLLFNLLAYYYAAQTNKIDEAQSLIDDVLQVYKDNSHFLDTQAMIYFQQKEYQRALDILELIILKEPHDSNILALLGKAYYGLGNVEKAIACIEKVIPLVKQEKEQESLKQLLESWKISSDD